MDTSPREDGFTLIELLVVVVIVGVLAAIAIPTFLSQRDGSMVAAAESDVRNAAVAVESHHARTNTYPADDTEFQTLVAAGDVLVTPGVTLMFASVGATYTILADHAGTSEPADARWDSSAGGLQ